MEKWIYNCKTKHTEQDAQTAKRLRALQEYQVFHKTKLTDLYKHLHSSAEDYQEPEENCRDHKR